MTEEQSYIYYKKIKYFVSLFINYFILLVAIWLCSGRKHPKKLLGYIYVSQKQQLVCNILGKMLPKECLLPVLTPLCATPLSPSPFLPTPPTPTLLTGPVYL